MSSQNRRIAEREFSISLHRKLHCCSLSHALSVTGLIGIQDE